MTENELLELVAQRITTKAAERMSHDNGWSKDQAAEYSKNEEEQACQAISARADEVYRELTARHIALGRIADDLGTTREAVAYLLR